MTSFFRFRRLHETKNLPDVTEPERTLRMLRLPPSNSTHSQSVETLSLTSSDAPPFCRLLHTKTDKDRSPSAACHRPPRVIRAGPLASLGHPCAAAEIKADESPFAHSSRVQRCSRCVFCSFSSPCSRVGSPFSFSLDDCAINDVVR